VNFSSCTSKKPFKVFSPELNNGGCSIVAITCGCGPQNESSILSFRPWVFLLEKEKLQCKRKLKEVK
jgi:hypothetical protein